jgi:hypothetical protein
MDREIQPRKCPERKEYNKTNKQLTWPWLKRHQRIPQKIVLDMRTVETKIYFENN